QVIIAEAVRLSQGPPASRTITSAPACVRVYAAMPPPAPEPTMQTSKTLDCVGGGEWRVGMAGKNAVGSAGRLAPRGVPENPGLAPGVGYTVHAATACFSDANGSRVGTNSWAANPANPRRPLPVRSAAE